MLGSRSLPSITSLSSRLWVPICTVTPTLPSTMAFLAGSVFAALLQGSGFSLLIHSIVAKVLF